jgi:hypothetical protein
MNREEREWWERTRARGKRRFVLLYFGAVLGLVLGTLTAVGAEWYTHGFSLQTFASTRFLLEWGVRLVIGFITGCLLGLWMWRQNEKKYQGK